MRKMLQLRAICFFAFLAYLCALHPPRSGRAAPVPKDFCTSCKCLEWKGFRDSDGNGGYAYYGVALLTGADYTITASAQFAPFITASSRCDAGTPTADILGETYWLIEVAMGDTHCGTGDRRELKTVTLLEETPGSLLWEFETKCK
jgi:hypothetical protein